MRVLLALMVCAPACVGHPLGSNIDAGLLDGASCQPSFVEAPDADQTATMRASCAFGAGSLVEETLGVTAHDRSAIPITHIVVVMQENRSFDHYWGQLPHDGQPDVDGIPANYANEDSNHAPVAPAHLNSTCVPTDPPHQWMAMHDGWNHGAMDGFVRSAAVNGSDGHFAIGYYDATDLPFYYWLASTFAISDRYFASSLAGTWTNRDYLYAGTSLGVQNTGDRSISEAHTVFDSLTQARVEWGVYTDGNPRQDCLGWSPAHAGVHSFQSLLDELTNGTLPPVAFVDPSGDGDEHPPGDVQRGELWSRRIYLAATASPLWSHLAVIFTYDETGGFFDHVPPPAACTPSADQTDFNRLGMRVPMAVVSPWARPHFVSHRVHEHSSVLRLIELLHDLPALTARDANSDAMLDLFDFHCAQLTTPPTPPAAGTNGCRH